jgi:hypothetical protein
MDNFRVHYSGACFERGDSPEQVERRIHDKLAILGEVLGVEARLLHPDEKEYSDGNYVVSFEGEIEVQAETQVKAENQAYDQLSHLGQITVVAFKKEGEVGGGHNEFHQRVDTGKHLSEKFYLFDCFRSLSFCF